MPKRFTDSNKWDDPWFCDLPNDDKLLWLYILDSCDHAGIWQANLRVLNFMLRTEYIIDDIISVLDGRLVNIDKDRYFIPKFIQFQYPNGLNEKNRAHASVLKLLSIYGLSKGLTSSSLGVKDKDKDKVKDTDKDKDQDIFGKPDNTPLTEDQIFRMESLEEWCKAVRAVGGIVHKDNFRHWMNILEKHGLRDVLKAVQGINGDKWANEAEKLLKPKMGDNSSSRRRADGTLLA